MTDAQSGRPTSNAMRRALKRARDGVALDVTEAAVLLQARGDDLTDLAASAARVRDAGLEAAGLLGRDHVLAQGLHPAHPPLP